MASYVSDTEIDHPVYTGNTTIIREPTKMMLLAAYSQFPYNFTLGVSILHPTDGECPPPPLGGVSFRDKNLSHYRNVIVTIRSILGWTAA
jgi:hypothetical protein